MTTTLSPAEVFRALVHGVCDRRWDDLPGLYAEETDVVHPLDPFRAPALRSRQEIREHFARATATLGDLRFQPANIRVHETGDPEVIVGEFEYRGTVPGTGEPFSAPGIFVLRVRDGQIVESRDYHDHLAMASAMGRLGQMLDALARHAGHAANP